MVSAVIGVGAAIAYAKIVQIRVATSTPPPPEAPIAVRVADITNVSYRLQNDGSGTVLARQSIMLSNEIGRYRTPHWF